MALELFISTCVATPYIMGSLSILTFYVTYRTLVCFCLHILIVTSGLYYRTVCMYIVCFCLHILIVTSGLYYRTVCMYIVFLLTYYIRRQ